MGRVSDCDARQRTLELAPFPAAPCIIGMIQETSYFGTKANILRFEWPNISTNDPNPGSGSKGVDPVFLLFLQISSNIKRHIVNMIKT